MESDARDRIDCFFTENSDQLKLLLNDTLMEEIQLKVAKILNLIPSTSVAINRFFGISSASEKQGKEWQQYSKKMFVYEQHRVS